MKWLKAFGSLFIDAGIKFNADKCQRYAAAMSYYTVFSLAPLLIILVAVLGLWFEGDEARQQLVSQVSDFAGTQVASTINSLIVAASKPVQSTFASIVAVAIFLFGASRVLVEMRAVLNTIWGFAQKEEEEELSIMKQVTQVILVRLFTILVLLILGFSILGLLLVSTYLSVANSWLVSNTPEVFPIRLILEPIFTIISLTGFFYIVMMVLPAHRPARINVFFGALVAAILFSFAKTVMAVYLSRAAATSIYGAASSLVVLMLWIFFSTCIFLYGAQIAATLRLRALDREKEELQAQLSQRQEKRAKEKTAKELSEQ